MGGDPPIQNGVELGHIPTRQVDAAEFTKNLTGYQPRPEDDASGRNQSQEGALGQQRQSFNLSNTSNAGDNLADQVRQTVQTSATTDFRDVAPNTEPPIIEQGLEQNVDVELFDTLHLTEDLGGHPSTDFASVNGDDPVSPTTGEFTMEKTDFAIAGVGAPLVFTRIYRSRWSYDGPLGFGWTHNFDQRLRFSSSACGDRSAGWSTGRGSTLHFRETSAGSWRSESGTTHKLRFESPYYVVTTPSGIETYFDQRGAPITISDQNQNAIALQWTSIPTGGPEDDLRLDIIVDTANRTYNFTYGADGYLDSIASPQIGVAALATYDVDALSDLRSVDAEGESAFYEYDTDPARDAAPFLLPTRDLQQSCESFCGLTQGSCGGACAAPAVAARTDCLETCSDPAACDVSCDLTVGSDCTALTDSSGDLASTQCQELCQTGCVSIPEPSRCAGLAPPTILLGESPGGGGPTIFEDLGATYSYYECSIGTFGPYRFGCPGLAERPDDEDTEARGCCLADGDVESQRLIYEACLADPPTAPSCTSGLTAPVSNYCDRSGSPSCAQWSTATNATSLCTTACAEPSQCPTACDEHVVCARYVSHTDLNGIAIFTAFGNAICQGDISCAAFINLFVNYAWNLIFGSDLWSGDSCAGLACTASMRNEEGGWRCNESDCLDACEPSDCPAECVDDLVSQCEWGQQSDCEATCVPGCKQMVVDRCVEEGEDHCTTTVCTAGALANRCKSACDDVDWVGLCASECVAECIETHDPCFGQTDCSERRFGNVAALNHNLVRASDGRTDSGGQLIYQIVNTYDLDPESPMFDRVVEQAFGGDTIRYGYFDLTHPEEIRTTDAHVGFVLGEAGIPTSAFASQGDDPLVRPGSRSLCAEGCSEELGRPTRAGRERWVRFGSGSYAVFPVELGGDYPVANPWDPGVGGWTMDLGGEPQGMAGYEWYELAVNSSGGLTAELSLSPPAPLPGGSIEVKTGAGLLTLTQLTGQLDQVTVTADVVDALDAAFGVSRQGRLSLVSARTGWTAFPGRVGAVVETSVEAVCGNEFFVSAVGGGADVIVKPPGACRGEATFREIGRRGDQRLGPSTGVTTASGWDSLLTDVRAAITWDFDGNTAAAPRGAVSQPGNRWMNGGLGEFPSAELCEGLLEAIAADLMCQAALPHYENTGYPAPDCGMPGAMRGMGTGHTPWPDGDVVGVGCGIGPDSFAPPMPSGCLEGSYQAPYELPFGATSIQPIKHMSIVVDPRGTAWVYHSDAFGKVLRLTNVDTGARIEWDYDRDGRLTAHQAAFGDRTCYTYDNDRNPIRVSLLPADGHWSTVEALHKRASYIANGRVDKVYDTDLSNQAPLVDHDYDGAGNLTRLTRTTGSSSLEYRVVTHDQGRPTSVRQVNGRIDKIEYNHHASGAPTNMIQNFGATSAQEIVIVPDDRGRPTQVAGPGRPTVDYHYTTQGLALESITRDPSKPAEHHTYHEDSAGRVFRIDGPAGDIEYTFNGRGLVESVREEALINGTMETHSACMRYDAGLLVDRIDPDGRWEHLVRDLNGDVVRVDRGIYGLTGDPWETDCSQNYVDTAPAGSEAFSSITRDAARGGIVTSETSATGSSSPATVSYTYDGYRRRVETVGPDGNKARVGYDFSGRVAWRALYGAGAASLPTTQTAFQPDTSDPELRSLVQYTYDLIGRIKEEKAAWFADDAAGVRQFFGTGPDVGWSVTRYTYDDVADTITTTFADGTSEVTSYDLFGRPTSTTLRDGTTIQSTVYADDLSNVTRTVAPAVNDLGNEYIQYRYESYGALASVRDRNGDALKTYGYDFMGRVDRTYAPAKNRGYSYDAFGRLEQVQRDPDGATPLTEFSYTYLASGKLDTLSSPNGAVTIGYDFAGRKRLETHDDQTTMAMSYVPGSRRIATSTDRRGVVATHVYDLAAGTLTVSAPNVVNGQNWTTTKVITTGPLGVESARAYTTSGGSSLTDVTLTYDRDSRGSVVAEGTSLYPGDTLQYAADAVGRTTSVVWPGDGLSFEYDSLGRLESVKRGGTEVVGYGYPAYGPPQSQTFANGLTETRSYDGDGRLYLRSVADATLATVGETAIVWGADRGIARADRSIGGSTWSDVFESGADEHLAAAASSAQGLPPPPAAPAVASSADVQAWLNAAPLTDTFAFGTNGSLSAVNRNGVGVTPTAPPDGQYTNFDGVVSTDADGRVLSTPDGSTYGYDGLGRLVRAEDLSGTVRTFWYDAADRLVRWDGDAQGSVVLQRAGRAVLREQQGTTSRTFVPGLGLEPAAVITSGGSTTYNHQAYGGRFAFATDATGAVVERYSYGAFGTPMVRDAAGVALTRSARGNRLLLSGQVFVPALGAYRLGQRWYRPEWAGFLSPDPTGFADGPNRFAFAHGAPNLFIDPFGLAGTPLPESNGGRLNGIGGFPGGGGALEELGTLRNFRNQVNRDAAEGERNRSLGTRGMRLDGEPRSSYRSPFAREQAERGNTKIAELIETDCHALYCHVVKANGRVPTNDEFDIRGLNHAVEGHASDAMTLILNGGLVLGRIGLPKPRVRPSRLHFDGMEVRAVRSMSHVDESTLRAMAERGFAAKDVHGKKLILHHLAQNPAGPVVEMPGFRHSIWNRVQHPFGNSPGVGLTPTQRAAFNAWRTSYWKARAAAELEKRGLTP